MWQGVPRFQRGALSPTGSRPVVLRASFDREEWKLAYLILDSTYYDRLIPYEKYNEHVRKMGQYLMAVPKVKTWIADKVAITWIEKVILASIGEILTEEQIQRSQVMDEAH